MSDTDSNIPVHSTVVKPVATYKDQNLANRDTELDFLDILGFIWKWRRLILVGVILGAVSSVALWYWKKTPENLLPADRLVQIFLPMELSTHDKREIIPVILTNYYKKTEGIKALHEGLKSAGFPQSISFSEEIALNEKFRGFFRKIDSDGEMLTVQVDASKGWVREDLSRAVLMGINSTIDSINSGFQNRMVGENEVEIELLKVQQKLAEIKLQSMKLFESYSKLNQIDRQGLLEEISGSNNNLDRIIFLLSGVPESDPQKKILIDTYRENIRNYGVIQGRLKSFDKYADLDIYLPIPKFENVAKLEIMTTVSSGTVSKLSSNLIALMTLGISAGFIGAIFLAIGCTFWNSNSPRIKGIIKS